jgi:hypothetical protein
VILVVMSAPRFVIGARRGACGGLLASHNGALAVVGLEGVLVGPSAIAARGAWAEVPIRRHTRPPPPLPDFEARCWGGWGATPSVLRATALPQATAVAWAPAPWDMIAVATSDGRVGVYAARGSASAVAAAAAAEGVAAAAPPGAAAAAAAGADTSAAAAAHVRPAVADVASWPAVLDHSSALAARAGGRHGAAVAWPVVDIKALAWARGGAAPDAAPRLIIANAAGELLVAGGAGRRSGVDVAATLPAGEVATALAVAPAATAVGIGGDDLLAVCTASGAVSLWTVGSGGGGGGGGDVDLCGDSEPGAPATLTPLVSLREAGWPGAQRVDAVQWWPGSTAARARLATVECGTLSVWAFVVPPAGAACGGAGTGVAPQSVTARVGDAGCMVSVCTPSRVGGARVTCASVIGAHGGAAIGGGLAWAPAGDRLVTAGDDGCVRVWGGTAAVLPAGAAAAAEAAGGGGAHAGGAPLAAAAALVTTCTTVRVSAHAAGGVAVVGAGRIAHVLVVVDSDERVAAAATAFQLRCAAAAPVCECVVGACGVRCLYACARACFSVCACACSCALLCLSTDDCSGVAALSTLGTRGMRMRCLVAPA